MDDAPAPLRFDRRWSPRHDLRGPGTLWCLGGERYGRAVAVRLADASAGGLGLVSDTAIAPGTPVVAETPGRPGAATPARRRGVVVRCTPCGDGYTVGVRYELRRAA